MPKKIEIYQVDAFTDAPFKGNPAGVCVTQEPLEDKLMQAIALEMNLSETAFAVPSDSGAITECSEFTLRWFTPMQEVDLCGHATLATAKILFDLCHVVCEKIRFQTKTGELIVGRKNAGFCLDFPVDRTNRTAIPDRVLEALKISTAEDCVASRRMRMLLVRLKEKREVIELNPDFTLLAAIEKSYGNHGFIVTAKGDEEFDFVSRFFAPGVGINEDPVTGSAHTVLCPYWSEILGKDRLNACQVSARRGILEVELHGDRVYIIGDAVVVIEGILHMESIQ